MFCVSIRFYRLSQFINSPEEPLSKINHSQQKGGYVYLQPLQSIQIILEILIPISLTLVTFSQPFHRVLTAQLRVLDALDEHLHPRHVLNGPLEEIGRFVGGFGQ